MDKDKKVLGFLKWCDRQHIKLEIGLSATGMIALSISNCDDEKMFFCGFAENMERLGRFFKVARKTL